MSWLKPTKVPSLRLIPCPTDLWYRSQGVVIDPRERERERREKREERAIWISPSGSWHQQDSHSKKLKNYTKNVILQEKIIVFYAILEKKTFYANPIFVGDYS